MLGQKVATLVSKELTAGTFSVVWNGMNDQGAAAPSGIYFARMVVRSGEGRNGDFSAVRKLMLMK